MTAPQQQPVPFEIVPQPGGQRVASNGELALVVLEDLPGAQVFRRRSVSGLPLKPAAELLIPQLNQLAGDLLANPDTNAEQARQRLAAIAGTVQTAEPVRSEALVVDVDGVRIYIAGTNVIVTRKDLRS